MDQVSNIMENKMNKKLYWLPAVKRLYGQLLFARKISFFMPTYSIIKEVLIINLALLFK